MVEDIFDFEDNGHPNSPKTESHKDDKPKIPPRRNVWITVLVGTALLVYDVFKTVSTVLGVAFLIRFFLIQPFYVSGPSMEPNFHNNQYIVVDQVSYRFREPRRGEVVVFKWPLNPTASFIKRIMALPGETIEVRDGKVYVNNKVINEPYLSFPNNINGSWTMNKNQYFVMGDNRTNSSDSRSWGPVDRKLIVGKVWVVIFPFSDFEWIKTPAYAKPR